MKNFANRLKFVEDMDNKKWDVLGDTVYIQPVGLALSGKQIAELRNVIYHIESHRLLSDTRHK